MSASSSISSPEELQSRTCKCGFMARYFTATTLENGGCDSTYFVVLVELDLIRKERNHLKKIVEDMGDIEDSYLKDMTADEMSELNDMKFLI
ncbi:hypothetical protein R3W88_000588 [Solanum pinnatisectum]|uniref:Uncharacterized protein n=1 Tax=Solanum pinnatisectum TaxID=50273 RepID=A0AAV9MGC6_9SOLN|nr:hypothetical protein R3W88_000588 [Solanum pinnatisectum]